MTATAVGTVDAPVDPSIMRQAMGQFASGVTVITTLDGEGNPTGCTMSAFSSLSLDPPLVLVCIGKDRSMAKWLQEGNGYVVNILAAHQADLALNFAGRAPNRFSEVSWQPGLHGMPRLDGVICHVECDLSSIADGGDHLIVIGAVAGAEVHDGDPLLYAQGKFGQMLQAKPSDGPASLPDEWLCSAPW
ncbi:flavin reductase family protein [Arthrobacter sp. AZCC_0090]|uniref:flavin reductase family protein n=1 Tax=Arthrobacter sp. AZCC_0090 TaxID=2735881 RepID=UPI00161EDA46|nr:flavin reductase family protein [Arthrobacter sp. AZCC_0090]MBB6405258.1 flavin reductase (DIM6/NTAB) family NADH-FMN oxidoreductase RutF [Arthrobacter sp. AZCC_0090]